MESTASSLSPEGSNFVTHDNDNAFAALSKFLEGSKVRIPPCLPGQDHEMNERAEGFVRTIDPALITVEDVMLYVPMWVWDFRWRLEHSSIECIYHNDVRARALARARQ